MERKIIAEAVDRYGNKYRLCWLPSKVEFVHWIVSKEEYCLGRYFPSLEGAVDDFQDRVKAYSESTEVDWILPAYRMTEAELVMELEVNQGEEV